MELRSYFYRLQWFEGGELIKFILCPIGCKSKCIKFYLHINFSYSLDRSSYLVEINKLHFRTLRLLLSNTECYRRSLSEKCWSQFSAIMVNCIICLTFGDPSLLMFTRFLSVIFLFYLVFRLKWFIVQILDALIMGGLVRKIKMKA